MKLLYSTFVLSLSAPSYGFTPGPRLSTLRNNVVKERKTSSTLQMSFIRDIFSDRSDSEEKEKKSLVARLSRRVSDTVNGWFGSEEEEPAEWEVKNDGICGFVPTKEMTGVEPHTTRLSATISSQLYDRVAAKDFQLSTKEHKTEVVVYDDHGIFKSTNPPMGVFVSGDTMFIGWRGTNSVTDGLNDIATSPSSSLSLRKYGKAIKTQGAMTSLAHNDIFIHEEMIIDEIKKRGIKEIVTTGHSLGGAIAQIAHLTLRAQMEDKNSPWSALKDVNVRSVCFSAPMTTVLLDDYNAETEQFIEDIVNNSCNCIFYNDFVPRSYGYMSFVEDVFDNCEEQLRKGIKLPWIARKLFSTREKVDNLIESVKTSDQVVDTVTVLSQYVHLGNIVYYESEDAKPRILRDMGAFYKNPEGKKDILRDVKYEPTKEPLTDKILDWHNFMVFGPGLAYPTSELDF